MLRIGYILTAIEFGGSEKVSLTFLNHVDRKLFDIFPVLLTRPWEKDNFFIRNLEDSYPVFKLPVAVRPKNEGNDYFRIIRCFKNLYRFLSEKKIELIHTHGYFADIIGIPAAKLLRIPHMSTCHGFISNDRHLVLYNKLDRIALRFSDKIIAVSEQIKEDLGKSEITKSKITVIQNAVQTTHTTDQSVVNRKKMRQALAIKDEEFAVGYVGRLSEEKGVKYLIEAVMLLIKSGEPCRLLIIGDGPKRKEFEGLIKGKGFKDNIILTGFQTNIEKWIPAFDIFVLPSLTEGTPVALLEAMSYGIPVIATHVGGVPKVIENGTNGILINPADSKALAENLKILCHDSALRKKFGTVSIDVVKKRHNINDWCRKIETQYNKLLK